MVLAALVVLSVFAGSFTGLAAATHSSDDFDEELQDGKTYWVGQSLLYQASANDTTYEVHGADESNSDYFQQIQSDADGHLLIDTSEMPAGTYELEDDTNTVVATFDVAQQTFDVTTSDDDTSDTIHTFNFDSNRVNFDVVVEATDLSADDLDAIFAEGVAEDTDGDGTNDRYVLSGISNGDAVEAQFSEEYTGEYDFTFTVDDTGAESAVNGFSATAPDDAEASFDESVYSEHEGDIATFTVELTNTDRANVTFGDEQEVGYENSFTVVDADGDGEVTVEFNTLNAGHPSDATVEAAGSDEINKSGHPTETDIGKYYLGAYTYSMSLSMNGEEQDIASLSLQDRNTEGASTYVVPGSAKAGSLEDIRANAVEGDTVALGDKLVVEIAASGLEAQLQDVSTSQIKAGAVAGLELTVEETNPGINRDARQLNISEAHIRTDAENDTYFLVFDTDDYNLADGDEYEVNFDLNEDNPYINSEEENESQDASATFSAVDREATLNDYDDREEKLFVTPDEQYTLQGETSIAPGSELTVIARAEGDSPFLYSEDVVVSEDGTFAATFDFSGLDVEDEFTVEVRGFNTYDAQAVAGAPEEYDLTVNAEGENGSAIDADITVDGEAVEDGSIALTDGTYTVEANAEGYYTASQQVTIDGEAREVTLTLEAEPQEHALDVNVEGADGESIDADVTVDGEAYVEGMMLQDGTYTVEANADGYEAASQQVTIDGADASVTLTLAEEEPEPTEEPNSTTEEPNNNNNSSEEPNTDDPAQPGFGALVALVALAGAALLARRE